MQYASQVNLNATVERDMFFKYQNNNNFFHLNIYLNIYLNNLLFYEPLIDIWSKYVQERIDTNKA